MSEEQSEAKSKKEEAFKRLMNQRLDKALDAIEKLEPLTNTVTYSYTHEQVIIVMEALHDAVEKVGKAFDNEGPIKRRGTLL